MFRISQYMNEFLNPKSLGSKRNPPGPVVIWNLIRRCNLTCKHCYSISADTDFPGELSTDQIFTVMDDLKQFRVPVLILSGGEPLMHPDIFKISRQAKEMGFFTALSTNGTLISDENIDAINEIGYDYVGISIDGIKETHDEFRRMEGGFDAALNGLRMCRDRGMKVGLRFTMTQDNAEELPQLLQLMDDEGVDKFYFSHLNYAGRGNKNREADVFLQTTRWAMELLFERALADVRAGKQTEFVTGNNDADGVYLLQWVKKHHPAQAEHIEAKLNQWGGNSSGVNVANIDNLGHVHPDTMWWGHDLGNVKTRLFSEIWMDTSDPIMAGLKATPRVISGRCAQCGYFGICGGNTRVRAMQLTGDPWSEDPACYLTDAEIGMEDKARDMESNPVELQKMK